MLDDYCKIVILKITLRHHQGFSSCLFIYFKYAKLPNETNVKISYVLLGMNMRAVIP